MATAGAVGYGYMDPLVWKSCLIIGDSHIARLKRAMDEQYLPSLPEFQLRANFGVEGNAEDCRIVFCGQGGLWVHDVHNMFGHITTVHPDIVCLHVGGNDVTEAEESPAYVAHELINIAEAILRRYGPQRHTCQIDSCFLATSRNKHEKYLTY